MERNIQIVACTEFFGGRVGMMGNIGEKGGITVRHISFSETIKWDCI